MTDLYADYPERAAFAAYETVRREAGINMADHERVAGLTHLTLAEVADLERRYDELILTHHDFIEFLVREGKIEPLNPYTIEDLERRKDRFEAERMRALIRGIEPPEGIDCPLLKAALVGVTAILTDNQDLDPAVLVSTGDIDGVIPVPVPPHDDKESQMHAYLASLIVATRISSHLTVIQDTYVSSYPSDEELDWTTIPRASEDPAAAEAAVVTHHHSSDGLGEFEVWMAKYHRGDDGTITLDAWEQMPGTELKAWLLEMLTVLIED